jgi:hypothetical protein
LKPHEKRKLSRFQALKLVDERTAIARGALKACLEESKKNEQLARLLMVFCAEAGGHLLVPQQRLDLLPPNAELHESYDKEQNAVLLRCVVPTPDPTTPAAATESADMAPVETDA